VEREAAGGEGEPGVEDGSQGESICLVEFREVRQEKSEEGAECPGEGWVENKAGFAGVPGGSLGPVGVEVAVRDLAGGFEPVEEVELEVVATRWAIDKKGDNGQEGGERDKEQVQARPGPEHVSFCQRGGLGGVFWWLGRGECVDKMWWICGEGRGEDPQDRSLRVEIWVADARGLEAMEGMVGFGRKVDADGVVGVDGSCG
jgi:hypothetical protein